MRDAFIKVQSTIEAIERAIAPEQFIAKNEPRSSWPVAVGLFGIGLGVGGERSGSGD
jgi:hypothetical protein